MSQLQQPRPRTMASDISKLFRPLRAEKDTEQAQTKKKITRIPLFGRTRKISSSSSPYASTSLSTDVEPQNSEPGRRPSLPTLPTKLPTSSFTTKFAARFSTSQSKPDLPLDSHASSCISLISSPSSSALVPPHPRPSYESALSTGTRNRSTTPRGARPVIMISTTDNMDEFKDLFTKELPTTKPSLSSQDSTDTTYRRGQTPASVLAAAVRDQQVHKRQPSTSSKISCDSEKSSNEKADARSATRLSTPRESPRIPKIEKHLPHPPSSRRPSSSQSLEGSLSIRSRPRAPSTGAARTKPPSIPLPEIPAASSHSKPDATDRLEPTPDPPSIRRPRSNTASSIPEHPPVASSSSSTNRSGSTTALDLLSVANIENLDIDAASPEHLRRALRCRNKQFEELTAYMLGREEAWSAERKALEKKISSLQRDLVRRESEITGLKLIINDEDVLRRPKPLLPGIHSRLSPASTSPVQSDQEGSTTGGSRRLNYQSDSGAESPRAGSGNESSSSLLRLRKMQHQRSSAIVGESYTSRTGSSIRLPKFAQSMTTVATPAASESPYAKRMSMMSITSSASSSGASSLMPPSPSVTMSSLSAIPEGATSGAVSHGAGPADGEERRALHASRRISASSVTSSSTAASSIAYSANVKRSRPPSIAQVLEKSPSTTIDDVLEKLRPFA